MESFVALAIIAACLSAIEKIIHKKNLLTIKDPAGYAAAFTFSCSAILVPKLFITDDLGITAASPEGIFAILCGGLFWAAFSYCTFSADKDLEASTKATITRLRVIWSIPIGYCLFQEQIGANAILGGTIIALSPLLIYLHNPPSFSKRGAAKEFLATIFLSLALAFDKIASNHFGVDLVLFFSFCVSFAVMQAIQLTITGRPIQFVEICFTSKVLISAIVSCSSYYFLLLSLSLGEFSIAILPRLN